MEATTMGRRKAGEPRPERKPVILTMKGDEAWGEWLREAAEHAGLTVSAFVDQSVRMYARKRGFHKDPPKR